MFPVYFKTKLTENQIKAKLRSHAKPWNINTISSADFFIYKLKGNRFFLNKNAKGDRRSLPFVGRIVEGKEETYLVGNFHLPRSFRNVMIAFTLMPVLNSIGEHAYALVIPLIMITVYVCMVYVFFFCVYSYVRKQVMDFMYEKLEITPTTRQEMVKGKRAKKAS